MTPLALCLTAAAAAIAAAATGRWLRSIRDQRAARQAAAQAELAHLRAHGELAVHDTEAVFLRFLAHHPELHSTSEDA